MNKILNYTTVVHESKSIESIRSSLVDCGVHTVAVEHQNGFPTCLRFSIMHSGQSMIFVIDCKINFVLDYLQELKIAQKYKTEAHARRVAWRLIKTWIDLQLSFVKIGWRTVEESFLSYVEIARGITFYKTLEVQGFKKLVEPIA